MAQSDVTRICMITFAKHFGISLESISITLVKEQSISLEGDVGPGQVTAGILSKCLVHTVHSPAGNYKVYMRTNGKGNVYWLAQ